MRDGPPAHEGLVSSETYMNWEKGFKGLSIGFMAIGSATNLRSMMCSLIPNLPCSNSVPKLYSISYNYNIMLVGVLNSFTYDYTFRLRMGGINLNYFILEETPISKLIIDKLVKLVFRFNGPNIIFSPYWLLVRDVNQNSLYSNWALTNQERLRLWSIIDAIIAKLYFINYNDLSWILKNDPTDPKGFWRVDKNIPQELRHTTLTLVAFRDLEKIIEENGGDVEKGIQAFCEQNDGEGWMIPEKIRFIQREDGTLDFDTPDSVEYEVRSKLGPRFYDWQLEGTPEDSWKECEMHARNILGDEEFEKFMKDLENEGSSNKDNFHSGDETVQIKQRTLTEY